ncbi:unnamed protein product [Prorocentrum cordatum]|uniref:Uncharacterized protein n=1 Tax=Prorocentrum cordatum TaxID=2364126 RepID=A0ABN9PSJ9_9DINO|nr:unnamed protein product [Polarella glacialis]
MVIAISTIGTPLSDLQTTAAERPQSRAPPGLRPRPAPQTSRPLATGPGLGAARSTFGRPARPARPAPGRASPRAGRGPGPRLVGDGEGPEALPRRRAKLGAGRGVGRGGRLRVLQEAGLGGVVRVLFTSSSE